MLPLLVVSLLWAFSFGLIKRHLAGIDATFVATARLGIALLIFLPFLRLRGLPGRTLLALAGIGAVQFGLMYVVYIESFRFLNSHEVALYTLTTPIFVTLLADAFAGSFHRRAMFAACLAVAGAAFVVRKSSQPVLGVLLVQISNLTFAFGQVAYRALRQREPALRDRDVFALLYAGAVAVAATALLWRGTIPSLAPPQILTLIYLGALASGAGFFLWNIGATRVGAGTLAVMNNAKVPLAVAVSLLIFGESGELLPLLTSLAILGSAAWLAGRK